MVNQSRHTGFQSIDISFLFLTCILNGCYTKSQSKKDIFSILPESHLTTTIWSLRTLGTTLGTLTYPGRGLGGRRLKVNLRGLESNLYTCHASWWPPPQLCQRFSQFWRPLWTVLAVSTNALSKLTAFLLAAASSILRSLIIFRIPFCIGKSWRSTVIWSKLWSIPSLLSTFTCAWDAKCKTKRKMWNEF